MIIIIVIIIRILMSKFGSKDIDLDKLIGGWVVNHVTMYYSLFALLSKQ
jgi:hypothetical protein